MNRYLIPLVGFFVLVAFLAIGLKLDPREIPSPLIDKPAPAFSVPTLFDPEQAIGTEKLRGQVWLLNVWASWCAACRDEHPLINELSKQDLVTLVGLNYKDERPDAKQWLKVFGDPYDHIAYDLEGNVGIDEWIRKFAEKCPGLAITQEVIVTGPRDFNFLEPSFWEGSENVPAADFSRFLALAEAGKPDSVPYKGPAREERAQAERADLEASMTHVKKVLGA